MFLNRNLLRSTIFALSTLLFVLWIFFIHVNWNYIQSLRSSDPLWLVKGVSPWLYILIVAYILLFFVILTYDLKGKLFHLIYISYLVLVIDSTPYFLSTLCRFPDTFGVVGSSVLLPEILSDSIMMSYPKSFPAAYMLSYIIHSLTGVDLFLFSRSIFSPLILVGIFVIWYLFIARLFDLRFAFISTIIAIPSQIIETSISPNSVGLILVLTSLLLCVSNKWNFRILFLTVEVTLVLTHAINPLVLFTILLFYYLFGSLLKSSTLDVSRTKIYSFLVLWITWILSESCIMGVGIVKTINHILTMEGQNLEQASTYTVGSGGLATYSWIQSLTMYKYELYGLVVIILIIFDIYFMDLYPLNMCKLNTLKNPNLLKKYSFLVMSLILLAITLSNLVFGGPDTENIISRTLNYSMLFISVFIAYSFLSLNAIHKPSFKVIRIFFIIVLLFVFITYPLYSYGRDSYINFPSSEKIGSDFFYSYVPENNPSIIGYSKSIYFHQLLHGKKPYISIKNLIYRNTVYSNGWYSIHI